MPISAQQWRLAVGRANASRSLRPHVTGQPKMKLTSLDVILFIFTTLLGAIMLYREGGRGTGERKCVSRGSGGGGTVGELAPSLLTAPCRKELLVLAGDVETNPGPYTIYGRLRHSDLELVMEELRGVEEKWRVIGRELPSGSIDNITYPDPTDCLRKVFKRWLQYSGTTWGHIIHALRKANEPQLADNLKAKYIPDWLEESDLNLLTQELRPAQHKWESIGREFHPYFFSADIRRQYHDDGDRLRAMLKRQLQDPDPTTTWRNIVDALRSPDVGDPQLADQLEAKYCPNLLPVSAVSGVVKELRVVRKKWRTIGEELGVKKYVLDRIRTNYSDAGNRLREVLSKRVSHHTTTWGDIAAVLRSPHVGQSQLADQLEAKYCPTAQKILEEALEKGYVECHIWKVLVTGAAGSGKTTLKYRLFGEEPPSLRCSTALAEAAIRAISRQIIGTDKTGWFRVTSDELMEMLGGALKAGVPMKELPSKVLEAPDYKKPGLFSRLFVWKSKYQKRTGNQPKQIAEKQHASIYSTAGSSALPSETSVASSQVSKTPVSTQVSYAKQELVQLVEKSQGSKRFLELQWIHFIDSGGQPQFHEVLPAFIRNTTATIFVMRLSERLDEHPMIEYYDINGDLCGKPYPHALRNDQMLQCCIRTLHSRPSTREGKHSKTLVVGTHKDRENSCSESRAEKNRKLIDMLTPSLQDHLVFYHPFSDVIFPINAKTPVAEDDQVCAIIRKHIEDKKCAPPSYKIPIGWFLLEQDVFNSTTGGVISKTECLRIALTLNMNAEALKAALEYFDNLNIFLYYPSVLPDLVFCDSQVLLNKVTELVHFSYSLQGDSPPVAVEGMWRQFQERGIVTLDMLRDDRFSAHYIPDLFSSADLIKLFKHLFIVAPLSSTEYFMPSLLQTIPSEEVSKWLPPPSMSVAPLLVHFPAGCAQNGVFCALVVYLLSECQWKFACSDKGIPLCVSRNCVCFQVPGKPVSITIVDSFTYYQLHVETLSTKLPKVCPMIREAIFSGLKAAAEALRYNNSTPVPAFLCKCSSPPHAATPTTDDEDCYLMCTKSNKPRPLTKKHTVWFSDTTDIAEGDGHDSVTPSVKKHDSEHPPPDVNGDELISCQSEHNSPQLQHPPSQDDQIDRPTLIACIRFRGRERRINIPQEIGVKYQDFGLFLLEDENRQRVKSIAQEYMNKAEEINKEILEQWITGRGKQPVTWKTLTEVLRDIELSTLAEEIELAIEH